MGTEEITDQINKALAAVNASDATDEYKVFAFKIVLCGLLGQGPVITSPDPKGATGAQAGTEETRAEDWQQQIANRLKLTTEQVAAIYHRESDTVLRLILDTSILPKNKQTATQDIAQLLAAGRVAAGFDESSTGAEVIRTEAEYYGRLDGNNFSRALHSLKPNFHYDGKEKTLTPRAPGFADAAAVAKRYLGQENK
jgi:hypothetical protein